MRGREIRIPLAVLFAIPLIVPTVTVAEELRLPRLSGVAPIQVDGSLADWRSDVPGLSLHWSQRAVPTVARKDGATASFRSFADDQFLYVGVDVAAPSLTFHSSPFNEAWRGDAVEVLFATASSDANLHVGRGAIRISADGFGRVITEGTLSIAHSSHQGRSVGYPLMWNALGVKSGLRQNGTGYSVEVAVPLRILGPQGDGALRMNVRVRRSDGHGPLTDVLEWVDDPYDTALESSETYRSVAFTQASSVGGLNYNDATGAILAALDRLAEHDAQDALIVLTGTKDQTLLPLVASAQVGAHQFQDAIHTLSSLADNPPAKLWALDLAAKVYFQLSDIGRAREALQKISWDNSPTVLDLKISGLAKLDLVAGDGDSAMRLQKDAFGDKAWDGVRTASQIGLWMQTNGKPDEALGQFQRVVDSNLAHDTERSWALLQIQKLHAKAGRTEECIATAWKLQLTAPPGDRSAPEGFPLLVSMFSYRLGSDRDPKHSFSSVYRQMIADQKVASDAARYLAFAEVLRSERDWRSASEICNRIAADPGTTRDVRARALLFLQRMDFSRGRQQASTQTGLSLQQKYPDAMEVRVSSWRLLNTSCAAGDTPVEVKEACATATETLVSDLRSQATQAGLADSAKAKAVLTSVFPAGAMR